VIPEARAFRVVGPAVRARLPAPIADDGDAVAVALAPADAASTASVARALPDPTSLPEGTLVVVLGAVADPSLASRLLSAVGRGRVVPRAHRCSALLARGYVRIGADLDEKSGQDLAWGFATGPC
jgi:hypothetical protein